MERYWSCLILPSCRLRCYRYQEHHCPTSHQRFPPNLEFCLGILRRPSLRQNWTKATVHRLMFRYAGLLDCTDHCLCSNSGDGIQASCSCCHRLYFPIQRCVWYRILSAHSQLFHRDSSIWYSSQGLQRIWIDSCGCPHIQPVWEAFILLLSHHWHTWSDMLIQ